MDKLPELTDKKKRMTMHVKMASTLNERIKLQSLDKMQDIEEECIEHGKVTGENRDDLTKYLQQKSEAALRTSVLEDAGCADMLRLLVIMVLCHKNLDELDAYITMAEASHE